MPLRKDSTVLVCGSRKWEDGDCIRALICSLPKTVTIIVGGAMGADRLAEDAARRRGQNVVVVKPGWSQGKSAGIKRNLEMLDMGPDLVVAFWKGNSPGTRHTVTETMRRKIPMRLEWRP